MNYSISTPWVIILIIAAVWELYWKYRALWRAARRKENIWFIAILVVNTAGVLPIYYLVSTGGIGHEND